MKAYFISLTTLLLVFTLSSCGWHLRGSQDNTFALTQINLSAADVYTSLYRDFKQVVEQQQIHISNEADAPKLYLVEEKFESRIVSLNTELDPAEDELKLSISYKINGQVYEVEAYQSWQRNHNQAAARDNARSVRKKQMRIELIERILRHVSLLENNPKKAPHTD